MSEFTYKIYPPLGVARVGDGPANKETRLLTPEVPWQHLYDTKVEYLVTSQELRNLLNNAMVTRVIEAVTKIEENVVSKTQKERFIGQLSKQNKTDLVELFATTSLHDVLDKKELRQIVDDLDLSVCPVEKGLLTILQDCCHVALNIKYKNTIKKQAQRFYIYKCDKDGNPLTRLNSNDFSQLKWSVDVANKKAFWYDYNNALDLSINQGNGNLAATVSEKKLAPALTAKRRNPNILGDKYRSQLVIRSQGSVSNNTPEKINLSGKFPANQAVKEHRLTQLLNIEQRHDVKQGSIEYEQDGALIFYAGDGISEALTPSSLNTDFADNSNWFDDICDGRITAELTLKGEDKPIILDQAENSAWITTAPPDYAPQIEPFVTMFDMLAGASYQPSDLSKIQTQFSDVFPILYRMYRMQWVNQADFSDNSLNVELANIDFTCLMTNTKDPSNKETNEKIRQRIFNLFRNPLFDGASVHLDPNGETLSSSRVIPSKDKTNIKQRSGKSELKLPYYPNDGVDYPGSPMQWFAIPPFMYQHLKNWSEGKFTVTDEEIKQSKNIDTLAKYYIEEVFGKSPNQALLSARAALDGLYGGGFHPGVELTWPMRRNAIYHNNSNQGGVTDKVNLLGLREFRLNAATEKQQQDIMYNDFGRIISVADVAQSIGKNADNDWLWQCTPGDLTKWMGIPWQSDAASCQAVYTAEDFPIPTWWAANLPVHIIPTDRYHKFKDSKTSDTVKPNGLTMPVAEALDESVFEQQRIAQFSQRLDWLHTADLGFVGYHAEGGYTNGLIQMVKQWKNLGMVMARPADKPSGNFKQSIPEVVYVAFSENDDK